MIVITNNQRLRRREIHVNDTRSTNIDKCIDAVEKITAIIPVSNNTRQIVEYNVDKKDDDPHQVDIKS